MKRVSVVALIVAKYQSPGAPPPPPPVEPELLELELLDDEELELELLPLLLLDEELLELDDVLPEEDELDDDDEPPVS